MSNIFDVAKYILQEIGEVSTMKLQKLCYYAQVKSLVETGKPLFSEKIEAWANGPVCRSLWNVHKGNFSIGAGAIRNDALSGEGIASENKTIVNEVLEEYGMMSGAQLSQLTHSEKPWLDAIEEQNSVVRLNKEITKKAIIDFYSKK